MQVLLIEEISKYLVLEPILLEADDSVPIFIGIIGKACPE
jgi:hypothetical protein